MVVVYGPDGQRVAFYNGTAMKTVPQFARDLLGRADLQPGRPADRPRRHRCRAALHRAGGSAAGAGQQQLLHQMVIQPLAPTDRIVAAYVGIYGFVALLILIASALLTRALVTLTFRSLGQVETTAMDNRRGRFQPTSDGHRPRHRVGRLKAAINAMLARIDGALNQRDATVRQMRRFIGDASHELRTPLVTMRGYAELYRMGAIGRTRTSPRPWSASRRKRSAWGLWSKTSCACASGRTTRRGDHDPRSASHRARCRARPSRDLPPARSPSMTRPAARPSCCRS